MSAPPTTRRVYRSRDDRMVAGVCGGIANYFGLDPVLVRVVLVALTVLGGSGVIAYGIAWIAIPEEPEDWVDDTEPRSSERPELAIGAVLIGLGALVVLPLMFDFGWGHDGPGDGDFFPAIVLVGIGAWLLMRNRGDSDDDWELPSHDATSSGRAPSAAAVAYARSTPGTDPTVVTDATEELDLPDGIEPVLPWTAYFPGPDPTSIADDFDEDELERSRRPRRGSPLASRLVVGALLVGGGIVWLLASNGTYDVSAGDALALALLVVGAGCVLAAFLGRGTGLLVWGMLLTVSLAGVSSLDVPLRGGFGERTLEPADLSALEADGPYETFAGKTVLDLSETELSAGSYEADITTAFGEIVVIVPDDLAVDLDVEMQAGEIENDFGPSGDDGWDLSLSDHIDPKGAEATLDLDIDVGFGHVEVQRA